MGLFGWLGFGSTTPTLGIQSPLAPTDDLVTFAADEWLRTRDDDKSKITTRETALLVPGVKRSHRLHASTVAGLEFKLLDGETGPFDKSEVAAEQPTWLTNGASGVAPYHRQYGMASDLFMNAWTCLAFTADLDDAMHVPFGWWGVDKTGAVVVTDTRIPIQYHAKPIAIPMGYGENGMLVDGIRTVRAALRIEEVWMERIENPLPATDLHIDDPQFDNLSRKKKRQMVDDWNENRARGGGQTAVTQSYLKVNALGQVSADLFEKGRNASRLDIANHGAVPASFIEGAKDTASTDVNYSNDSTERSSLFEFGTKGFVQAIEARLSLPDIAGPGRRIRADVTGFTPVAIAASPPAPVTDPSTAEQEN